MRIAVLRLAAFLLPAFGLYAAPPSNDDVTNGATVFSNTSANGTTVNATAQSGEPSHSGSAATHSVWYFVQVDSLKNGTVTVTPTGFDARIALYKGSSSDFGSLVAVDSANAAASGGAESVHFTNFAFSDEILLVAVDGVSGGSGTFSIQFQTTSAALANDNFANAAVLPTTPQLMALNTTGATAESGEPQLNGGAPQSLWYRFTAPEAGKFSVVHNSNSGPAPNYAIFTGSGVNALATVSDYADSQSEISIQQGQTFFIAASTPGGQSTFATFNYSFRTLDPGSFEFLTDQRFVAESDGSVVFTVARNGSADGAVSVPYTITPGTAGTSDYTGTGGTVDFADGQYSAEITIGIVDDALLEGDESFSVTLGTPSAGTLDAAVTGTATIQANDTGGGGGGGGGGPFDFMLPNAGYSGLINVGFPQAGFGTLQFFTQDTSTTGKLIFDGITVPFKAPFVSSPTNATLNANLKAKRGKTTLNLALSLTLQSDGVHFTGSLSGAGPTTYTIAGERDGVGSKVLPVAHAGRYNAIIDGTVGTDVRGIATVAVKPTGSATMTGILPDGTKFAAGGKTSLLGHLYFAKGLYKKEALKTTGYVAGTLTFNPTAVPRSVVGTAHWNKPSGNGKLYPAGVANAALSIDGAEYKAPAPGQRALSDFDAGGGVMVDISEGNLTAPIAKAATIDTANRATIITPAADKLKLAINTALGTFGGSFVHSDGKPRTIVGILVPTSPGRAEGLFLGTDSGGIITITP